MKKKLYLAAAFCMIIATGCTNNKKSANSDNVVADTMQVADMHNAETSLDYFGEYKGTIPAADCPGIEVTLIFNKDRTYTQKYIYLERKDGEFNETGTFKVEGNILTATSKNGEKSYYKVEEGRIVILDADKQPITGALADMYVLKQEKYSDIQTTPPDVCPPTFPDLLQCTLLQLLCKPVDTM